jgi:integrase/recombinase XerD
MSVTIYLVLDTRRIKKRSGKYPVKLRVNFERGTTDYQTVFDLKKEEEYEKLSKTHIGEKLQEIRDKLNDLEVRAREYAKTLDPFSYAEFELGFVHQDPLFKPRELKRSATIEDPREFDYSPYLKKFPILQEQHPFPNCISVFYVFYTKELIRLGQIGTAFTYQSSFAAIKRFRGNMAFKKITTTFLREFERWLVTDGKSKAYVGSILRTLRRIFNLAIDAKIIKRENCYPFGKCKYVIPTKRRKKEALEKQDISDVYYSKIGDENINKAIAYWLFLYFGNGMNPKDAARTKWRNITGMMMKFDRAKTETTSREDVEPITVFLNEDLLNIIEKYGNEDRSPDNYIFPILKKGLNPLDEHLRIRSFTGFIRRYLKKAFALLGIDKKSGPQQTRIAFVNHMKKAGADVEMVQKMVGHQDPQTTKGYMEDIEDYEKKQYADTLLSFKRDYGEGFVS